jgi:hypothetical protein
MPAPDLMFEHGLDVKKGWFDMASLDYDAKLNSNVSFDVTPGAHNTGVAIFLLNGSADADVSNPGTTAAGNFMHKAIAPGGKMSGIVATGGYEISTTEFDSARSYAPGDLLTAAISTSNATTGGVLTNNGVVQYVNPVVGVVSGGKAKNHNGVQSLSFWCVWLPGAAVG